MSSITDYSSAVGAAVVAFALFTAVLLVMYLWKADKLKYYTAFPIIGALLIIAALILFLTPPTVMGSPNPPSQIDLKIRRVSGATQKLSPDPFTFDPGSADQLSTFHTNDASSYVDQYSCLTKSSNTIWSTDRKKCQCVTGWFGSTCEDRMYDDRYVSLTPVPSSRITPTYGAAVNTPNLTIWSTSVGTGCTDICNSNPNCLGVTYHQGSCTPILSLLFSGPPIQDTSVVTNSDTMYLHKSRLNKINMVGYYNVIFGNLPARYFVGNVVAENTGQNYYLTNNNSRVVYFVTNADNTFVGIPDYIIVNNLGQLHISTSPIPNPLPAGTGSGLIVSYSTPIMLTKENFTRDFGRATSTTTFYIRYVPS